MASNHEVKILKVLSVSPSESGNNLSLPLSFIDLIWFNFHPVKRLFFYDHPNLTPSIFSETILPRLQMSLSITLSHYLPLAGVLTWPNDSERPEIQYKQGDSILLSVAQADDAALFGYLSSDQARCENALHHLVSELSRSDTQASVIALQVTLFPNVGLSIGITSHHAALDGKSSIMFMKAWAYTHQLMQEGKDVGTLTQELTPTFDRKFFQDPNGTDKLLEFLVSLTNRSTKEVKFMQHQESSEELFRSTFKLSRADISHLKEKLASWQEKLGKKDTLHVSSFVVTYAYFLVCLLRTTGFESDYQKAWFSFVADYRERLEPPIPTNYGGNCTFMVDAISIEDKDLMQEDCMGIVAEKISGAIKSIEKPVNTEKLVSKLSSVKLEKGVKVIGVAGGPRLGVYGVDFGWGKAKKVEIVSSNENNIAFTQSRDEKGGIEVGIVLKQSHVELFNQKFQLGLKHSS